MFKERLLQKCELQFYPGDSHYTNITNFTAGTELSNMYRVYLKETLSAPGALLRCRL